MGMHRLVGIAGLLLVMVATAHAESLAKRRLPADQFHGWTIVELDCTESLLRQIWRQPLTELPKDTSGYTLVSYQAEHVDSTADANKRIQFILQKQRFNEYIGKGYELTVLPWTAQGKQGAIFTVRGTEQNTTVAAAHRADIYTVVFQHAEWVVWFELRQVYTAPDLAAADKLQKKSTAQSVTDDLTATVARLWGETETEVTPAAPATLPAAPAPAAPAAPTTAPAPVPATPPAATPAPAPTAPPAVTSTAPAAPPAATPMPAPVAPAPAEKETPVVAPAAAAPQPAATPPDPNRWTTGDRHLSLKLPDGWHVTGEGPHTFTGFPSATIRLYPADTYTTDGELTQALEEFVKSQQQIAKKPFTRRDFMPDGATGVQVSYRSYDKHMVYVYYFGKSGRLWRFSVEMADEKAPLPPIVSTMLETIHLD